MRTSSVSQICLTSRYQNVIISRKNFFWRQPYSLRVRTLQAEPSVFFHYIFFVNEPKTRTVRISLRDDSQIKNHLRNYILTARLGEHCQLHVLWITCGEVPRSRGPHANKSGHNNPAPKESQPMARLYIEVIRLAMYGNSTRLLAIAPAI